MNDPAAGASPPVPEDVAGSRSADRGRASLSLPQAGLVEPDSADSFERLVLEHGPTVTRLVRRLLGWSGDVDDVVQDVFVAALKGLDRFDRRSSVATWLTRIAINCCRSHQRKARLQRLIPFQRLRPASLEQSVGATLLERESGEQVRTAIRQLPVRDREVIVLRYLEELSIDEIAEICGVSGGAVEVRLSRARRKLETLLKPYMEQ